ncbi:MAG: gliding motility-associated C-terminal domain-containing protein [Bacteroidia bacterium]|nr:gliding motility-associated C-terminal domain-containing protein [Bacteroidia bacterium]
MRKALLYIFIVLSVVSYAQDNVVTPKVDPTLFFTQNKGQWDSKINYRARFDGGTLYMENDGITYAFFDKKKYINFHMGGLAKDKNPKLKAHAIKVEFLGCNQNLKIQSEDEGDFYENYYLGSDRTKWKGGVKNFHKVWYRNLYNGIDYEAITTIRGLKYNFYVNPAGDPSKIQLKYNGVDRMKLVKGELVIRTSIDSIMEGKPYAYQNINGKITEVLCKYKLKNNIVSFEFPNGYNKAYELVIDPILVFAAQSGSFADNFGMTATYDNGGNLYSGGTVFDNGFPTTTGAYDILFNGTPAAGNTDVVVTKYNPSGTGLLFSTYLGGSGSEIVTSLIVDVNNNLFLYGATGSSDFPISAGAYDATFNGGNFINFMFNGTQFTNGTDIYVAKFNATGTSLAGSTYIGGSDNDGVNHTNAVITYTTPYTATYTPGSSTATGPCVATSAAFSITEYKADSLQYNYGDQYRGEIQLDKFGNVYIASSSRSANFPIVGGFDNTLGGKQDAVIIKFNPTLTGVVWSSYLGGSQNDAGYSLIVTDSLFTYVTGGTFSTDFPTQPGCYNTAYNGGKADGYIVKINPTGNAILKGTYLGTSDYDQSYFIAKEKTKNDVYVYGQSLGSMTVTPGVYSNAGSHQFITRLDGQLNNVNMGTVIGSTFNKIDISPSAFSVDNCGNIYLSGWGGNIIGGAPTTNMPTTPGAFQVNTANGFDFYLCVLSANATSQLYGTYFGGSCTSEHVDGGTSRFDPKGIIYQSVCAGCQNNEDFPVSPGAWPNSPGNNNKSNNCNNGVFKFDFQIKITNVNIATNTITGCQPLLVNFSNSTYAGGTFTWNFGGGNTNTTTINPSYTFTNPGTYTVTLVVNDTSSCNKIDSTLTFITVYPSVTVAATASQVPCSDTLQYNGSATTTATLNTFQWNFQPGGAITTSTINAPINSYTSSGTYTAQLLAINNFGCRDSAIVSVNINTLVPTVTSNTICQGASGGITAGGGTSYSWTPATGLSNTTIANPIANPTITTTYSVVVTNTLTGCTRTLTTVVTVNPKPTADFTFITNPCGGGVNFTDNSAANITQWFWNFGNLQTSTIQNPYQFYSPGGTFNVSLIAGNVFNCYDTIVKPVTVGSPPPVSVSSTQTICLGGFVTLNATGGIAYQWSPTVSLINPTAASPIATPTISTQYSVVITTTNSIGTCTIMLTTDVIVTQASAFPISATANPSVVNLGNSSVLTLSASPNASVTWYPIGSTAPINGYTVNATPPHTTTYTVVIQRGPCTDTTLVRVEVIEDGCFDTDVFVPNTFTPNGDGVNDIMYARGHKLTTIYFAIYNRWGEMVFETNDIKTGWDGNYKGRPADVGVFGYYVKYTCVSGQENFKKGNITLIR